MVKPEEKSLTAPISLPSSQGRKTRKASRTGAAARLPIVRAQIRLPNDLNEKMPSAPCTPVNIRKDIQLSKLVEEQGSSVDRTSLQVETVHDLQVEKKPAPKSVASMVRR